MDHIPLTKYQTWGRVDIPCLTEKNYDCWDYEDLPAQQGYVDRSYLEWLDFLGAPPPGYDGFMQLWRYFGFIATVFRDAQGRRPTLAALSRRGTDGMRYIDTSKLISIVQRSVPGLDRDQPKSDRFRQRMKSAQQFFKAMEASQVLSEPWRKEDNRISSGKENPENEKISLSKALMTLRAVDPLPLSVKYSIMLIHEFVRKVEVFIPLQIDQQFQQEPWAHVLPKAE